MICKSCEQHIPYNSRSKVFTGWCRHCATKKAITNIKKYWGEDVKAN
jgi:hypothetical protein